MATTQDGKGALRSSPTPRPAPPRAWPGSTDRGARFPRMIKHLRIENFRCLRKVEFDLEPLTVLVGPNGSGKSSVLRAIEKTRTGFGDHFDRWNRRLDLTLIVEAITASGPLGGIYASKSGLHRQGGICDAQLIQLELQKLRTPIGLQAAERVASDGSNLANVFDSLGRPVEARAAKLFSELVPSFADVNVKPTSNGGHGFFFTDRWDPAVEYVPEHVSDGTMLVLAYVTILHQRNVPDLLAIEEPERGLHPYLLRELMGLLRKLTTGELGTKPIQVLLATHSPQLLNYVEPHEVRFLRLSKDDGNVVVESAPTGTADWAKVYEEYDESMGGLWLSGGLGGVPGT